MHDIALVLGKFVFEVRRDMPYSEYLDWLSYIEEHGPLNPMIRTDAAVARVAAMMSRGRTLRDFMPWPKESVQEAAPEAVLGLLQRVAAANKKPN